MSLPRPVEAVIFDCDGTLADTEPLAWDAWRTVLDRFGIEVTDDDVRQCTGRSLDATYEHFARRASLPERAVLAAEQQRLAVASITAHARPFDDAVRACRSLVARGVPLAVASSSARVRLDATLRRIGLETFFPVSIAGDEVERGKPDPQILLVAAARLEVRPAGCVVIEDAAPGVRAAQRAGMGCVVVRRDHNRASVERFGADVVCDDLDGLDRLLVEGAPLPVAEQQAPTRQAPQPAPEERRAPADPPAHRTPSHPVPRASR